MSCTRTLPSTHDDNGRYDVLAFGTKSPSKGRLLRRRTASTGCRVSCSSGVAAAVRHSSRNVHDREAGHLRTPSESDQIDS